MLVNALEMEGEMEGERKENIQYTVHICIEV